VGSSVFGDLEFALRVSKTQKDVGNFRIWFSGHGFQDLGSQLWGLGNFRIWFSGHGFQDLGSQLWGLGNFRIWFLGRDFQDLGSQFWDLDFTQGASHDPGLGIFLAHDFQDMDGEPGNFTVSEGHGHPLVLFKEYYFSFKKKCK
jgi:hypothetical protein